MNRIYSLIFVFILALSCVCQSAFANDQDEAPPPRLSQEDIARIMGEVLGNAALVNTILSFLPLSTDSRNLMTALTLGRQFTRSSPLDNLITFRRQHPELGRLRIRPYEGGAFPSAPLPNFIRVRSPSMGRRPFPFGRGPNQDFEFLSLGRYVGYGLQTRAMTIAAAKKYRDSRNPGSTVTAPNKLRLSHANPSYGRRRLKVPDGTPEFTTLFMESLITGDPNRLLVATQGQPGQNNLKLLRLAGRASPVDILEIPNFLQYPNQALSVEISHVVTSLDNISDDVLRQYLDLLLGADDQPYFWDHESHNPGGAGGPPPPPPGVL